MSAHTIAPSQFSLQPGGRVVLRVEAGPPQSFTVGRDLEEAFVTPAIPAGGAYEWCAAAAQSVALWVLAPRLALSCNALTCKTFFGPAVLCN